MTYQEVKVLGLGLKHTEAFVLLSVLQDIPPHVLLNSTVELEQASLPEKVADLTAHQLYEVALTAIGKHFNIYQNISTERRNNGSLTPAEQLTHRFLYDLRSHINSVNAAIHQYSIGIQELVRPRKESRIDLDKRSTHLRILEYIWHAQSYKDLQRFVQADADLTHLLAFNNATSYFAWKYDDTLIDVVKFLEQTQPEMISAAVTEGLPLIRSDIQRVKRDLFLVAANKGKTERQKKKSELSREEENAIEESAREMFTILGKLKLRVGAKIPAEVVEALVQAEYGDRNRLLSEYFSTWSKNGGKLPLDLVTFGIGEVYYDILHKMLVTVYGEAPLPEPS